MTTPIRKCTHRKPTTREYDVYDLDGDGRDERLSVHHDKCETEESVPKKTSWLTMSSGQRIDIKPAPEASDLKTIRFQDHILNVGDTIDATVDGNPVRGVIECFFLKPVFLEINLKVSTKAAMHIVAIVKTEQGATELIIPHGTLMTESAKIMFNTK